MKFSRTLLAALAVMLVFAFAPLASAGDGTADDPIEVLYVFADWDGWPFDTYPDFNTPGVAVYNGIYVNVTSMAGYEAGSYWSEPSAEFYAAAESDYAGYDVVFVDMVNMYMDAFETGASNAAEDGKLLVAVRTGPNNNTCYMPLSFAIRDTPALSASSDYYDVTFTGDFFYVHDNGPGATGTATATESAAMAEVVAEYFLTL